MKEVYIKNMNVIENEGINIFKRVEMATKYRKIIPLEDRDDELYRPPPPEVYEAVKKERKARKQFWEELNKEKKGVVKKLK